MKKLVLRLPVPAPGSAAGSSGNTEVSMKRAVGCAVVVFMIAANGHSAEFRHIRPFENSNLVKSSTAGVHTDMGFDRSAGLLLLERKVFPFNTHLDGAWNVSLVSLDGAPISKKGQMRIVARTVSGVEIMTIKANAMRKTLPGNGLRKTGNSVEGLDFQFKSYVLDIPAGGSLDFFYHARRQDTGPGKFYYQALLVDDDGDSDRD